LCRSFLYRSFLCRRHILIYINCVDSRTASSMCAMQHCVIISRRCIFLISWPRA
jgi:hypothetical protein